MSNNEIEDLRQQIEQMVREEYADSFAQLEKQRQEHDLRKAGWDAILGRIVEHYKGPLTLADFAHLEQFLERLDEIVKLGLDFEKLTNAIKTNEIVQSQWDKMLMSMRLVGMDNSTSGPENE